jgi:D-alanyl-D-alanine carboxypeptidase (penicillin-binding protein 5/6)
MKKLITALFLFVAIILPINCLGVYATRSDSILNSKSKSALLMNFHGGEILYSYNENAKYPIASMCKIMTLILIFEDIEAQNMKFDDEIQISENASGMGGSQAFLEANGIYKAHELIKSIIISSANDSCVAFAEKISGSENAFVEKMNERAKQLNMTNTIFSNCTGLPKPNQYSSAKDVATMLKELLKHREYFKFSRIWMDKIEHSGGRVTELTNTNKLIRFYEGCDGGKTGYTNEAGHCLAASVNRGGMRLISVVIGAPDSTTRFEESKTLFNYGFANYTNKMIVDDKRPLDEKIQIKGGKVNEISVIAARPYFRFTKRNDKENIVMEFTKNNKLKAPINQGDIIGQINIYKENVKLDSIDVLANESVESKSLFDYIEDIAEGWNI